MFYIRVQLSVAVIVCLICFGVFAEAQTTTRDQAKQPATFMDRVIEMNHAEIQLAHLAMTEAQDPQVKEFAESIVRDHMQELNRLQGAGNQADRQPGQTDQDLTDRREQHGVLPGQDGIEADSAAREKPSAPTTTDRSMLTREHQQVIDRLSKLSGPQFDKEFIDVMVREHRNALQVVEREANRPQTGTDRNASSQNSATVARELLPQLRQHLTETEQIQRQLQSSNIR